MPSLGRSTRPLKLPVLGRYLAPPKDDRSRNDTGPSLVSSPGAYLGGTSLWSLYSLLSLFW